jgi:hypothetical protein
MAALEKMLPISSSVPEVKAFKRNLMLRLEADAAALNPMPSKANSQVPMEQFTTAMYQEAADAQRGGRFDHSVVMAFGVASTLCTVCQHHFGESPRLSAMAQDADRQAAEVTRAMAVGARPVAVVAPQPTPGAPSPPAASAPPSRPEVAATAATGATDAPIPLARAPPPPSAASLFAYAASPAAGAAPIDLPAHERMLRQCQAAQTALRHGITALQGDDTTTCHGKIQDVFSALASYQFNSSNYAVDRTPQDPAFKAMRLLKHAVSALHFQDINTALGTSPVLLGQS